MTADPFLRYRDQFPILKSKRYLVSHSLGAMPLGAREALLDYADVWATSGVDGWTERWWMMSIEVGDLIAPIIGAPKGSIVMLPNVTVAEAVALSSFEFKKPRNRVVMVEGEFPSVRYVYERLARRLGAEVVVIPASGLSFDLDRLLTAIDERTEVVAISHVLFESSAIVDVPAISKRCRETGATLIADLFQSAGTVPVELAKWDVPIAVGGVLKWLCGGPGGGYLYVDPKLRPKLEPYFTGWMAHANPFSFEAPPMKFRDDALRFAIGTPAVPALYAASAGPKLLWEAAGQDMNAIRSKSLRMTQRMIGFADEHGFELRTPREAEKRGGTVCMKVPEAQRVAGALNAAGVACDWRPNAGIRLGPHFYTTDEELDSALGTIAEVVG